MTDKKISKLQIVLVAIFLLIVGFVLYFPMSQKTPANNSISTSTTTWTTYKNTDLGFQIDYQNRLVITINKYGVGFGENNGDGTVGIWAIGVNVSTTTQKITDVLKSYSNDVFEKKFTIDGFDAYEYGVPEEKDGPVYTHTVLVINGKKLYEINVREGQYNDQIINSFHFLK